MSKTRLMLRAEVTSTTTSFISYAFDLTPTSAFVVTEWAPEIGTVVALQLGLHGLVPPLAVDGVVVARRLAGSPGDVAGVEIELDASAGPGVEDFIRALDRTPVADRPRRPYRVLIVEDSRLVGEMLASALSRTEHGHAVVDRVEDIESAWSKLGATSYDAAIVDYFLPGNTGASLIARLRDDERFARLPVVAISVGGHDAREASFAAGADLFLDKPFAFRDLSHTLEVVRRCKQVLEEAS